MARKRLCRSLDLYSHFTVHVSFLREEEEEEFHYIHAASKGL